MSAPIEQLKRIAVRDVKDHTAIFDLYVVLGRDVETLAIKFGMDISDIITLLSGYGEAVSDKAMGRLPGLSRLLVEEYVEHFYPGIASENPQNDWINLEAYLDVYHPNWRGLMRSKGPEVKKKKRNRGLY